MLLAAAAAAVIVLIVLYLLGSVLLTIGLSAVIAYTLLPVVKLLERGMPWRGRYPDLSRVIAILIVFLAGLVAVAGVLMSVIPPMLREAGVFIEEFPRFFNSARLTVESWIAVYSDRIPEDLKQNAEEQLAGLGNVLIGVVWTGVGKDGRAGIQHIQPHCRSGHASDTGLLPDEGLRLNQFGGGSPPFQAQCTRISGPCWTSWTVPWGRTSGGN